VVRGFRSRRRNFLTGINHGSLRFDLLISCSGGFTGSGNHLNFKNS
jgi:hypothetical protein